MQDPSRSFKDLSLDYCRKALSELIKRENDEVAALAALRPLPHFFSFVSAKREGEEALIKTRALKERLSDELRLLLDCLKRNRALPMISRDPDEMVSISIGSVYGKCILLNDNGGLFYIPHKTGGVEMGHMVPMKFLKPFSVLRKSERCMILRALLRVPDTPGFAREIIEIKLKEEQGNVSELQSQQGHGSRKAGAESGA